jgi:hypothetical protein
LERNGAVIAWRAAKKPVTARCTADSEYTAVAMAVDEALSLSRVAAEISLCSSRFWAATAPSFKGTLRLNLSQSKVAESAAGSRTTVCELAKFRRNHILTKKALRSICSREPLQNVVTQVPLKRATLNTDGRGCVARSPGKGTTKRHRNTHQTSL